MKGAALAEHDTGIVVIGTARQRRNGKRVTLKGNKAHGRIGRTTAGNSTRTSRTCRWSKALKLAALLANAQRHCLQWSGVQRCLSHSRVRQTGLGFGVGQTRRWLSLAAPDKLIEPSVCREHLISIVTPLRRVGSRGIRTLRRIHLWRRQRQSGSPLDFCPAGNEVSPYPQG